MPIFYVSTPGAEALISAAANREHAPPAVEDRTSPTEPHSSDRLTGRALSAAGRRVARAVGGEVAREVEREESVS